MTVLNKKIIKNIAATTALAAITLPLWAANQGTLGATSTGDLTISMTTENQISITNLQDIALADNGSGDFTGASPACVYRNGTGSYTITASGSGPANAFTLTDGSSNTLPYTVTYDDGTGAQTMAAATALTGRINADTSSKTCANGDNGNIAVSVASTDVAAVPAGTYTGTLTLTVSPE